ncbi:MAG: hypothetical protein GX072_14510 [Lysinibacillus sp.]|nr:hypothetical protein [Lysinibacillus sp.]
MKKFELLLPLTFFLLIIGMLVGHYMVVDRKVSDLENRALTAFNKEPTMQDIFTGEWSQHVEQYFVDQFPLRDWWIENYMKFQLTSGKMYINDQYHVAYNEGWITTKPVLEDYEQQINSFANEIKTLKEQLARNNIPFTYYSLPAKATYVHIYEPDYMPDDIGKERRKELHRLLDELEVDNVSVFDEMNYDGPLEDLYFKTDHHWNGIGAYFGYQAILKEISERLNEPLAALSISEENAYCLKNDFIGSWNRVVYKLVKSDEQVCYYEPENFFDRFTIYEGGVAVGKKIAVEDYFAPAKQLEATEEINYANSYSMDYGEIQILNEDYDSEKHIVVIKDSYFNAMQMYLASHFKQFTILDLRYLDKPLVEYIEQLNPDYVMLAYNDRNLELFIEIN